MPSVLASKLAREHAAEIAALERDELVRLAKLYREARVELMARLAESAPERFTAQHFRATLLQIEAGLRAMRERLGAEFVPRIDAAADRGAEQIVEQIAFWERAGDFREGAFGRIQLGALQRVQRELLADRFESSVETFGREILDDVRRRLGVHMAMRSRWSEMTADVAGKLERSAIAGARWKAERIVRTELHHALNAGHQATLESAVATLPDLQRQWDSTLDARTSDICKALNGQVRGLREPWVFNGRQIAAPPARPNCRAKILPWRTAWNGRKK